MGQHYTSFLLRHWAFADGARRITVEQVQTGAQVTVATLADATAWIGARTAGAGAPQEAAGEGTDLPDAGVARRAAREGRESATQRRPTRP